MCFCPESRKSPPSGWTSHYKRIALLKSCWFYRRLTRSREATIRSTWPANAFLIDFASSTVQRSWSWRFSTWLAGPTIYLLQHHVDKLRVLSNQMFVCSGHSATLQPNKWQISNHSPLRQINFKHIINHLSTQQAGLCVITSVLQPDQFHFFIARIADDDDGDCIESIRSLERSLLGFPMAAIFHRPSEFASGRQRTHQPPSPNASTQLAATMLGRWTTKIGEVYFSQKQTCKG